MKNIFIILMISVFVFSFSACGWEVAIREPEENSSSLSESETDPLSERKTSVREKAYAMGYSDEIIDWVYECFSDEKAENILLNPMSVCTVRTSESALCYEKLFLGAWQFYHDGEGQPVYFPYLRTPEGEIKIIPERLDYRYGFGVLDENTVYFSHDEHISFYHITLTASQKSVWTPLEAKNAVLGSVIEIKGMDALVVFWADIGSDSTYQISYVDFDGNEIMHINSDIELIFDNGKPKETGIISDSYEDFGILRFTINGLFYDLYLENGEIEDITGTLGASKAPNGLPSPSLTVFEGENGKRGLKKGEDIIVDAAYDSIEIVEPNIYYNDEIPPVSHFYVAFNENGTYTALAHYPESQKPYLFQNQKFEYTIFAPDGSKINDIPFEKYECSEGVRGVANGTVYYYEYDGEKFFLLYESKPESFLNEFGYYVTEYNWNYYGTPYVGLSDSSGNIILEPIYSKLEMFFPDRICRYNGPSAYMDWDFGHCEITDLAGNIICDKFDAVWYFFFDDGSYIGIGRSGMSEIKAVDENGEPMPAGFWFIDKDGNILSERFKRIETNLSTGELSYTKDGKIAVILSDGTESSVEPSGYIQK